jgi:hypothetical protein
VSGRRPSGEERRGPAGSDYTNGRRGEDSNSYNSPLGKTSAIDIYAGSPASRRKPSIDVVRKSEERDRDFPGRPSLSSMSDSTLNAQSSTATSGVIVPNKSTITEEEIEVPFGREARREARESLGIAVDDRDRSIERGGSGSGNLDSGRITDGEPESASDYASVKSPPLGGLSGLSARLRDVENEDDPGSPGGAGITQGGNDNYDKPSFGRPSDRSGAFGSRGLGRASSSAADQEKIRSEYEYKIAKMQTQISTLQRDLGDAESKERKWLDGEEKVRQMEEELMGLRRVSNFTKFFFSRLTVWFSVRKSKVPLCALCRRSWTSYTKFVRESRIVKLDGLERTMTKSGSGENSPNVSKKSVQGCKRV